MNNKIITMTKCLYCGEQWATEEEDEVCKDCVPKVLEDMATADLVDAAKRLQEYSKHNKLRNKNLIEPVIKVLKTLI